MQIFRRSELVLICYFLYTSLLAVLLPVTQFITVITITLNITVLAGYALLAYADSLRRWRPLGIVRDWFPLPLTLLGYREMGWFAQPHPNIDLEQSWVVWDRLLLNDWGLRAAIEILGPLLPGVLEVSYLLVYLISPFSVAALYVCGRRDKVDTLLFVSVLGVLLSDALFPYFPSEPPRTVFPGEDLPSYELAVRRFTLGLLGHYGIHTSVFPSAHVSGAFSAAFGMVRALPEKKWIWRGLFALAILIALATVYGRYHYLVDALAGLAVSFVAAGFTGWVEQRSRAQRNRLRA